LIEEGRDYRQGLIQLSYLRRTINGRRLVMTKKNHMYALSRYPSVTYGDIHKEFVMDIIQLSDGSLLSCSYEGTIKRWSPDNGQLINVFVGHSETVASLMEIDDNTFRSGSTDTSVRVWDKATGKRTDISYLPGTALMSQLSLRDGTSFLWGLATGPIYMMNKNTSGGASLDGHTACVTCMCELSNGDVVSGSADMTLRVWNLWRRRAIHTLTGHSEWVQKVIELKDKTVASASDDDTVRIWDVVRGQCLQVLQHSSAVRGLLELPDGTLVTGEVAKLIRVWNTNGECISDCEVDHHIVCMRLISDGSIVTGGYHGEIQVRKTWLRYSECIASLDSSP